MSGVRGIAKNLSALLSARVITMVQQVSLVPLFIHAYGKAGYGQWLAISAAVSYLGTLDFGVQTFVNQDLTVRYHRGDMDEFHLNQSTALRLLLGIVSAAACLSLLVFLLPLQHLLNMDGAKGDPIVGAHVVQIAVFVMAMQALVSIIFGYFNGTFMVVDRSYLGAYWNNARMLVQFLTVLGAVLVHASFASIALTQLVGLSLCLAIQLYHLHRMAPQIFPTLRYWDAALVPKILKPSGYFALIFSSGFLVYQLPVLILQRTAGGTAVTLFSVMRTIFSMTRTLLNGPTQAIGPEITGLFARDDWKGLARLYDYSERMIFSLIPCVNMGTLYLCPFLLTVWIKQPQLFLPGVYLTSAALSIVMSTKEHKFQFQFSTNTHQELARFMFVTYLMLGGLWVVIIPRYGVAGLVGCWLAVESVQLGYLIWLNARFFKAHEVIERRYLTRLGLLSVGGLAVAWMTVGSTKMLPLPTQIAIAVSAGVVLLGAAVPLFHLIPVWAGVRERLRSRFAQPSAG